jgi:hypothetical protein
MKKIIRNLASDANKAFWKDAETVATEVRSWPDWKRAGINVSNVRTDVKAAAGEKDSTRTKK